jgi:hypothetical protein
MVPYIGLNQILKRQTFRFHYGSKVPAVIIAVFKYRNKIGKMIRNHIQLNLSKPNILGTNFCVHNKRNDQKTATMKRMQSYVTLHSVTNRACTKHIRVFPRFAPNTHIYLYASTVHMYCIYPAIVNRK